MLKNWARGSKIELAATRTTGSRASPSVEEVDIMVIGEDNIPACCKLKAGEIDAIIDVPFNQDPVDRSRSGDVTAEVARSYRIDMVQLNTTKKPLRQ